MGENMSALGSLVVKLALEYAEYTKGLDKGSQEALTFAKNVQRSMDTASKAGTEFFGGVAKGALQAVAAYASVTAVVDRFRTSLDALGQLDDMAQKTGSSVENLSRLQKVASTFGANFGDVDTALSKLSKNMNGVDEDSSKMRAAMDALGLSTANLKNSDPSETFVTIAKKLQDYKDGAGKTALVIDLLGKSGANLLPYMNDVAESVDKFTGVSPEAAAAGAKLQDQLGMLRTRSDEFSQTLTIDLLPSFNDFVGMLTDTRNEGGKLYTDGSITSWSDDVAVGLARVMDVAKLVPNAVRAISGSVKVMVADVEFWAKTAATVASAPTQIATGNSPWSAMKKNWAERNKVLDDANKQYTSLWNAPGDAMEKSMLARIAARGVADDGLSSFAMDKRGVDYNGSESKSKAAKERISDYEKLTRKISEKTAADQMQINLGRPLTESEKEIAKVQADRLTGAVKLTDAEFASVKMQIEKQGVLERILSSREATEKMEKERMETAQKEIASAFEAVEAARKEVETYGMLPSIISMVTLSKLEQRKASLEANEGTTTEIAGVEGLIAAQKKLIGFQQSKEQLDNAKVQADQAVAAAQKAADETQKVWDNFGENMQRNLGDGLYNAMEGNFSSIGTAFSSMVKRMAADALAAQLSEKLLGAKGSSGGGLLGLAFKTAMAFAAPTGTGTVGGTVTGDTGSDWSTSLLSKSALGNTFDNGRMLAFADGGAFTNGIVESPTKFNIGLMGEAGPEAIMPLSRGADGSLGVKTNGGGGGSMNVTYAPQITIDGSTDMAKNRQMIDQAVRQGNAQLVDMLMRDRRL